MCGMVHRDRSEVSFQCACRSIAERSIWILLSYRISLYPQTVYSLCAEATEYFLDITPARLPTAKTPKHYLRLQQILHWDFHLYVYDADIDTVNKLSAAIINVAPSNYVGAVAILVNCSDHGNFGNDNNVCMHDQIELSVEKLRQDPLVSFVNEC